MHVEKEREKEAYKEKRSGKIGNPTRKATTYMSGIKVLIDTNPQNWHPQSSPRVVVPFLSQPAHSQPRGSGVSCLSPVTESIGVWASSLQGKGNGTTCLGSPHRNSSESQLGCSTSARPRPLIASASAANQSHAQNSSMGRQKETKVTQKKRA